jgi:AhpD family alkylhydroperoxidase
MEKRVEIKTAFPDAYKAVHALSARLSKTGLTPIQKELIKIRASQINACAFCLNMHTKEALEVGETQQRIFLLDAWRETDLFAEEEKAILALTEEVTLIHKHGVSDEVYQQAKKFFTDEVIAQIIMAIVLINAWNRIAVSTHAPIEN